jgi:hypothetical protein
VKFSIDFSKRLLQNQLMNEAQLSTAIDHRIFGFTELGQLRANLYNGAQPDAGALYSWVWASTLRHLAHKLDEQWEQPLSESEFDVIEQLDAVDAELSNDCEDCGGTGRDPGSLNPFEPEDCPSCNGTGQESEFPMLTRRPAGRQSLNAPARKEVA